MASNELLRLHRIIADHPTPAERKASERFLSEAYELRLAAAEEAEADDDPDGIDEHARAAEFNAAFHSPYSDEPEDSTGDDESYDYETDTDDSGWFFSEDAEHAGVPHDPEAAQVPGQDYAGQLDDRPAPTDPVAAAEALPDGPAVADDAAKR